MVRARDGLWVTVAYERSTRAEHLPGSSRGAEVHRTLPQALTRLGVALAASIGREAGVRHRMIGAVSSLEETFAASGGLFGALFAPPPAAAVAQALELAALHPGVRTGGPMDFEIRRSVDPPSAAPLLVVEGWPRSLVLRQGELLRAWNRGDPVDRRPSPEQAVEAIHLAAALAQDAAGQGLASAFSGWSAWRAFGAGQDGIGAQAAAIAAAVRELDAGLADRSSLDVGFRAAVRAARLAMDRAPTDSRSLRAVAAVCLHGGQDRSAIGRSAWRSVARLADALAVAQEARGAVRSAAVYGR